MSRHILSVDDLLKVAVTGAGMPTALPGPKVPSAPNFVPKSPMLTSKAPVAKPVKAPKPAAVAKPAAGGAAGGKGFVATAPKPPPIPSPTQRPKLSLGSRAQGSGLAQPRDPRARAVAPLPGVGKPVQAGERVTASGQVTSAPKPRPAPVSNGRNPDGTPAARGMPRRVTATTVRDTPVPEKRKRPAKPRATAARRKAVKQGVQAASPAERKAGMSIATPQRLQEIRRGGAIQQGVSRASPAEQQGGMSIATPKRQQQIARGPTSTPAPGANMSTPQSSPAAAPTVTRTQRPGGSQQIQASFPRPGGGAAPAAAPKPIPDRGNILRDRFMTQEQKAGTFDERMARRTAHMTPEQRARTMAAAPMAGKSPAERREMIRKNRQTQPEAGVLTASRRKDRGARPA